MRTALPLKAFNKVLRFFQTNTCKFSVELNCVNFAVAHNGVNEILRSPLDRRR